MSQKARPQQSPFSLSLRDLFALIFFAAIVAISLRSPDQAALVLSGAWHLGVLLAAVGAVQRGPVAAGCRAGLLVVVTLQISNPLLVDAIAEHFASRSADDWTFEDDSLSFPESQFNLDVVPAASAEFATTIHYLMQFGLGLLAARLAWGFDLRRSRADAACDQLTTELSAVGAGVSRATQEDSDGHLGEPID